MYKKDQYIQAKIKPFSIHKILEVDYCDERALIRNINPKMASTNGVWNKFSILKKYTNILHAYNTPLYKVLNL